MKKLVLAEKPSVARDLARVLGCAKGGKGFLEGKDYIVTWALGHLVTLADPEKYDDKYKTWAMEHLPMMPEKMKLTPIKQTRAQFNTVSALVKRNDVSEIIIATDAGREGELVARWILALLPVKKPLKRLWISSVTDRAIRDGFNKLQDAKKYEGLYHSAVARAEADWIVGMNATRALTCKHNASLSCGRVQTPTLAMIAERDRQIQEFQPQPYKVIEARAEGLAFVWHQSGGERRMFDLDRAMQIAKVVEQKGLVVTQSETKRKRSAAPKLYNLTDLQRDANRLFGWGAKETLNVLQGLYEQEKLVTYPRTDSNYLSSDMRDTLIERVKACRYPDVQPVVRDIIKQGLPKLTCIDDKKVTDHHAIIPTEESYGARRLDGKADRLYRLIAERFLANMCAPSESEQQNIHAQCGDEQFTSKKEWLVVPGWRAVYGEEGMVDTVVPRLDKGTKLAVEHTSTETRYTEPPSRFTEGTLLEAMSNPVKFMSDASQSAKKTLTEAGGIGTVATRADIIEKLLENFYIERRGQELWITSKGKQLLDLAPSDLKTPLLTAKWEGELQQIAEGKKSSRAFLADIRAYTATIVEEIREQDARFKHDNVSQTACPTCGKFMLEVKGKKGRMLVCQDRECNTRKSLARETNVRCPECKKRMELRGEGDAQYYACKCGFREKRTVWEKRFQDKRQTKATKNDVRKYMNNQQSDIGNDALREQLSKLFKK
ncbi:MAG: DNA topoisomerase III [Bacilli bacterium]